MFKKGVSPLIASVFLIGFAIVVGVMIFASTFNLNANLLEDQDKRIESAILLSFDAKYPRDFNCSASCSSGNVSCSSDSCYCILIENEENRIVNYMVKTAGNLGREVCSPENFELGPFQSKIFAVGFNNVTVGNEDITSEIEAVLILDN